MRLGRLRGTPEFPVDSLLRTRQVGHFYSLTMLVRISEPAATVENGSIATESRKSPPRRRQAVHLITCIGKLEWYLSTPIAPDCRHIRLH